MLNNLTVAQIKKALGGKKVFSHDLVQALLQDERAGVRKIGENLKKEMEKRQEKIALYRQMEAFDQDFRLRFGKNIVGVDEVGRGPLAGPVVACAVILPKKVPLYGVQDSKKLSIRDRERLFCQIHKYSREIKLGLVGVGKIDGMNISRASQKAMRMALHRIDENIDLVLVDGNQKLGGILPPQQTVTGGDSKSLAIASASVVAKVLRDWIMEVLDGEFPQYGWKENKGYGTADHLQAIEKYGVTCQHRRTFAPVREKEGKGGTLFG